MLVNGGSGRIGITNSDQYAGNTISNNGGDGIHLQYGATALTGGNTISGNGTDPSTLIDRSGIALFHATAAIVGDNKITGNHGAGIIARSSSLRLGEGRFGLPPGNEISGNGISTFEGGVFAFLGQARGRSSLISLIYFGLLTEAEPLT
jgi:parallel beta-helix repeat protein